MPFENKNERIYKMKTPYPKRSIKSRVKPEDMGTSRDKVINYYRRTIQVRQERINRLVDKLKEKENSDNELRKEFRRELKKKDTQYKRLEKKFNDFKERKGQRHRTVVHKVKYKTYEPTKKVNQFEQLCNSSKLLHQDYLGIMEYRLKTLKFLSTTEYTKITDDHIFLLLMIHTLNRPVSMRDLNTPHLSDKNRRLFVKHLEEYLLVTKKTPRIYEITALGIDFLNDYKNFLSYGKSEVLEEFKRLHGI